MSRSERPQEDAESPTRRFDAGLPPDEGEGVAADVTRLDDGEFGFHVDDPEDAPRGEFDPDEVGETDTNVLDSLAEAFNARDLDTMLESLAADGEAPGLLGGDRESLAEAVEGLWHRRPTCCVTRGRVEGVVVGVLWEHDGAAWWPLATVHVADLDDDGMVGVLEFSDDVALLDEVEAESPDGDLEEGSRWSEWDEGSD